MKYQNPEHDELVDKSPKSSKIHSFYFVKYRIYQNNELETKIYQAQEKIKNLEETCTLIRGTILQEKLSVTNYVNRLWLNCRPWGLIREDDRYKNAINEKKTKIVFQRQADIGKLRARFDTSREKGDDTCSSEKELNNRVCSLHFRTRCAKVTLIAEKQLLKEIKQLEETRQKIIVNDALKHKRFSDSMELINGRSRMPINRGRYSCDYYRKLKNLKDMDLDKLKREKQVLSARVKNAEETYKLRNYDEIPSLELKLARTIEKRTAEENLLAKLKKQWREEKLNYKQQYYNKYIAVLNNARKLAAKKNIAALEELSCKEVCYGINRIRRDINTHLRKTL
ncbi:hypothetical protein MKW94_024733 [Papaver nudicaule]|uniref:Uncharacterized protein n=1 Tax=Papaver nudicaule TaxID=74823 RepID=A0AA41VWK9_PAPNU|nr:hypothetical protein [Papaver nudicaule]